MGDGGKWIRAQCLTLSRSNNTPVSYWLSLPVGSLRYWIAAHNALEAELSKQREEARRKARKK